MNIKHSMIAASILLISALQASEFIQKILPDDSLVKQFDRTEERSWWKSLLGIDSRKRQACDAIERVLERSITRIEAMEQNGFNPDTSLSLFSLSALIWTSSGLDIVSRAPSLFFGEDEKGLGYLELQTIKNAVEPYVQKCEEMKNKYIEEQKAKALNQKAQMLAQLQQTKS